MPVTGQFSPSIVQPLSMSEDISAHLDGGPRAMSRWRGN